MQWPRVARGFVLLSGILAPVAARADVQSLVVFGDSLLDTGNLFAASGNPPPPYYQGRFSNGPVWVEYFAKGLNVADPTPSLTGGTNYAWGGAETGTGGSPQGGVPNVNTQVASFLSGHSLSASQLVVLDGGANDFFDGKTDPNLPVNNLAAAITALAAAGGKQFVVQNIPQLGEIPASRSLSPSDRAALDALSLAYDSQLHARLGQLRASLGVSIAEVDLNSLLLTIRSNPGEYGFTNATTDALDDGVLSGAGYLFWDNVHPTTAADRIIAGAALAAVPEPSPLALAALAAGAAGLSAAMKRRARPVV